MQAEPKNSLVGEEYEVEVGPVAHGGHCVARTAEGQVLFVRHALPGEKVVARVTEGEEGARTKQARAHGVELAAAAGGGDGDGQEQHGVAAIEQAVASRVA